MELDDTPESLQLLLMRITTLLLAIAMFVAVPVTAAETDERGAAHARVSATAPIFADYHDSRQATEAWGERYEVWPYQGGTLVRYLYGWEDCPGGGCLKWRVYDYLLHRDGTVTFDEVFGLPLPPEAPAELRAFDATLTGTSPRGAAPTPSATPDAHGATETDGHSDDEHGDDAGGHGEEAAGGHGGHGGDRAAAPTGIAAAIAAVIVGYGLGALTIGALHHRRRTR